VRWPAQAAQAAQLKRDPLGGIKQPSRMFLSKRAAALAQYEGHDHGCYQ